MKQDIVNGIESIEFATIVGGVVQNNWLRMENIEDGSVSITSNADTKTNIIPEDKDVAILVLYTPGDPDTFNFALLEISPVNAGLYFNTVYDPTTSKVVVLAQKKYANLAIRFTSRPQNGFKKRFTYSNASCLPTYKNNITKNGLLTIAVAASILPYKDAGSGKDAVYFVEMLNADGTAVDSTPPTVNAGADGTSSSATKALTGTATAATPKTIVSTLWTQVSGPNTAGFSAPNSLSTNATGLVTGTYVFRLSATDSESITATDDITIVATVA